MVGSYAISPILSRRQMCKAAPRPSRLATPPVASREQDGDGFDQPCPAGHGSTPCSTLRALRRPAPLPAADPRVAMGCWNDVDLPFYYGLARAFPVADRWFSSCLGPTFPNRRFLVAGTANGLTTDSIAHTFDHPANGTVFDLLTTHRISWANYHSVPH